ncbi:MAG: hypothetical protein OEN50_04840 [Deltaproteobacteria bacterium]|nr:hypothetical protein [Deltaproteobacteria bacterium]
MKKFDYVKEKDKAAFTKYKVNRFPTIIVASKNKTYSRATGYKSSKTILRMKGSNRAIKPKKPGPRPGRDLFGTQHLGCESH